MFEDSKITFKRYHIDMADQAHTLIAGTTGSGKSVALNGFIYSQLCESPTERQFIFIDPKGVELIQYKDLPHTLAHEHTPEGIENAIRWAFDEMERRFNEMMSKRQKKYDGPHIYVIIDEYIDIKLHCSKETHKLIANIATKGRAAKIHLIICTQDPTQNSVDLLLKRNLPCTLALHVANKSQSIYMIERAGLEKLPIGYAYYISPATHGEPELVPVDLIPDEEIQKHIDEWAQLVAIRNQEQQAQSKPVNKLKQLWHKLRG